MNLHGVLGKFVGHFHQIARDFNWVPETQGVVRGHGRDETVAYSQLPDHSFQPLLTHL